MRAAVTGLPRNSAEFLRLPKSQQRRIVAGILHHGETLVAKLAEGLEDLDALTIRELQKLYAYTAAQDGAPPEAVFFFAVNERKQSKEELLDVLGMVLN